MCDLVVYYADEGEALPDGWLSVGDWRTTVYVVFRAYMQVYRCVSAPYIVHTQFQQSNFEYRLVQDWEVTRHIPGQISRWVHSFIADGTLYEEIDWFLTGSKFDAETRSRINKRQRR